MKNYTFIQENGNVENSNISNGDDIYIVLKKPLDKTYNQKYKNIIIYLCKFENIKKNVLFKINF